MKPLKKSVSLTTLIKRYVWWEKPDWTYQYPLVFLSILMNQGAWDDILKARKLLGDSVFKQALLKAPPGYFSNRSWDYWHLKFKIKPIPKLPQRTFK